MGNEGKFPIWTREYTKERLGEFQKHVESWRGRTSIGQWHDIAGIPQDSLGRYAKKFGMYDVYCRIKKQIKR